MNEVQQMVANFVGNTEQYKEINDFFTNKLELISNYVRTIATSVTYLLYIVTQTY